MDVNKYLKYIWVKFVMVKDFCGNFFAAVYVSANSSAKSAEGTKKGKAKSNIFPCKKLLNVFHKISVPFPMYLVLQRLYRQYRGKEM